MSRNKIIDINKWPRTISQKKSMNQLLAARKISREDKIKKIESEADELLSILDNDQDNK
ncbi:hypothetical protein [Bacillus sp. J37]|uniref:hypothetical protein n=1 Tax=Bacillus sp. J37 TaxID=935837 RepID=UPI0018DD61D4|nr:hypothetical protein [Bacillus sp. J37]